MADEERATEGKASTGEDNTFEALEREFQEVLQQPRNPVTA